MERNIQSVDYYKDVLRQAIGLTDRLSVKTKQEILSFKEKLQEYIKLVDTYVIRPPDIAADQVWEEGIETETQMTLIRDDLDRMGNEILREIAIAKETYK